MIIKLHGTSGSGKTTVARKLIESAATKKDLPNLGRRPSGYELWIDGLQRPLYVLGPYETVCGGLDALGEADDHIRLLLEYGPKGHVFYEGLLQSGFYGRIGAASEQFGDDHVFAFLDTPIDLCIERIKARRLARGNTTPLNPENTIDKFQAIARLKWKLDNAVGVPKRRTATILHEQAFAAVMDLYLGAEDAAQS